MQPRSAFSRPPAFLRRKNPRPIKGRLTLATKPLCRLLCHPRAGGGPCAAAGIPYTAYTFDTTLFFRRYP